ncbi:MAG TPA: dihydrofolate reductase family protein [Actinopolymorphaceae bacterium]
MGTIIYSMNVSLDGYIEDSQGSFGFSAPADDVHRLANEQTRATSVFLFGRRLFEVMEEPWRAAANRYDLPEVEKDFARLYLSIPRIVFSDTLMSVPEGVRLVRSTDAVAEVTRLKEDVDGQLAIGGAGLAASLVDFIDEFRLYVTPVVVGGGKPFFPVGRTLDLRLVESRTLGSGSVYLRYERAGKS